MDPLSTISTAISLAKGLYELYDSIEHKKSCCKQLFDRCNLFVPRLEVLRSRQQLDESMKRSVNRFFVLIEDVNKSCQKYTKKSYLSKMFEEVAGKAGCNFGADFEGVHRELTLLQQDTTFAMVADNGKVQEQLLTSIESDLVAFRDQMGILLELQEELLVGQRESRKEAKQATQEVVGKVDGMQAAMHRQLAETEKQILAALAPFLEVQRAIHIDSSPSESHGSTSPTSPRTKLASLQELKERVVAAVPSLFSTPPELLSEDAFIGSGGYADVYRAVYEGRPVAVKKLKDYKHYSEQETRLMIREVLILQKLKHRHIISSPVADIDRGYIVLELAQCTLFTFLHRKDQLPKGFSVTLDRLRALLDMASALRFLHFHGIIHRDIKPTNILLCRGNDGPSNAIGGSRMVAKIGDFGLSTASNMKSVVQSRSRRGGPVGTSAFMAPECFEDDVKHTSAVDVFGWALTGNEMYTGVITWEGKSDIVIMRSVVAKELRPVMFTPSSLQEDALKKLFGDAGSGCLHQDPKMRPAMEDCYEVLVDILTESYSLVAVDKDCAIYGEVAASNEATVETNEGGDFQSKQSKEDWLGYVTNEATVPVQEGKPINRQVSESNEEAYDAAEKIRNERREEAKQARFDFKKFPALRSLDDFAKGSVLIGEKVRESFLIFQSMVIPKSLTEINKKESKLAVQLHRKLLGYMGDRHSSSPATLAREILQEGFDNKAIRNEIYLQIIKQLTGNPNHESIFKGWHILCMCVGTFPPSPDFENFLLHYVIEKKDHGQGAAVDFARYCLRSLEAMLSNGDGTGFVPRIDEILAYKERPPILATIHLVDGSVITEDLPITPDLKVGKVLEMCIGWLDFKDPRVDSFGIFVYDMGESEDAATMNESLRNAPYKDLPRTPRPLRNDDFMGDIFVLRARQRRKFKFVLKKKIFMASRNGRGSDPFYERLVYLQAKDEAIIQGNIDVGDEEKVAGLAGISMAVADGDDMGSTVEEMCVEGEGNVMDFIVPAWRDVHTPEEWADLILQSREVLVNSDPEDLQEQFLQIVQESALYGAHWFYVYSVEPPSSTVVPDSIRQLPREIMLGFNAEGMHIFNMKRELLVSFPYHDINRWEGNAGQFSVILAHPSLPDSFEFVVITSQAPDLAAIILDHIRAIIALQETKFLLSRRWI